MTYQKVTIDRRVIPDGAVESQWHAPDGWPIRRIDLKAGDDARGSLLFMPGRGDIYEKYLETLVHFHAQGWNVTSSDWRGQGGSGRLTPNQYVGHIDDFSTWIGDIAFFWERWKAENPGPHVVVGHSMGGHLLVRALIDKVIDPVAAVLSAPMLGLHNYGLPLSFGQKIARLMMKLGDPLRPAWKVSEKPASPLRIRQKLLTHDSDRYEDELQWWAQRPELVMGPGSWTWVERAFASAQYNSAPGRYEGIDCPVLLIGTTADQLVRYGAIAEAAERIPGAELKTYGKECAHEILREADPVRDEVLRLIDDFLERKAHR